MNERLPSLKSLEALAVVGRTGSVVRAAETLSITPSAVSHRLRSLESDLGLTLFDRSGRGVELTETGLHYFRVVEGAFENIREATGRLRKGGLVDTLVVNVVHALAANWILPSLSEFRSRHPDVRLSFHPKTSLEYGSTKPQDLRGRVEIRFGRGEWPGFHCEPILRCLTFPVCSPALLQGADAIRTPEDLARHTWIHLTLNPQAWRHWLEVAGLPDLRPRDEMILEDPELKRTAAVHGLGVALGVDVLVERDLASGALVAPFDVRHEAREGYYLLCHPDDVADHRIQAFLAWLKELAARRTREPPRTRNGRDEFVSGRVQ